jgi:hypothetical protein
MLVVTSQKALDSIKRHRPPRDRAGPLGVQRVYAPAGGAHDPLAIYRIVQEGLEKSERLDGAGGEQPFAVIDITAVSASGPGVRCRRQPPG